MNAMLPFILKTYHFLEKYLRFLVRYFSLVYQQESPAVADKPERRYRNLGHGSLKGIESGTIQ